MYLIAIAWMYVVVMMALAEALSPQGTVLGAIFTLLLYGLLPLSIVMYLLGTPIRRRALRAAEADAEAGREHQASQSPAEAAASAPKPDGGGHAAGDAVAPERKEV
jgi:membrane protein implicated in regulation of membrane protease activity